MTAHIPFVARTHSTDVAVEDLTLCKNSNLDEDTSSYMANITSFFSPCTKPSTMEEEDLLSRKRINADPRELFYTKMCNKNLLMQVSAAFPSNTPKLELQHCWNMLIKENHIKVKLTEELVAEALESASKPDDARMKKIGNYFSPITKVGCSLEFLVTFINIMLKKSFN